LKIGIRAGSLVAPLFRRHRRHFGHVVLLSSKVT
jgi:hypothetical protein